MIDDRVLTDLLYHRLYEWNKAAMLPERDGTALWLLKVEIYNLKTGQKLLMCWLSIAEKHSSGECA